MSRNLNEIFEALANSPFRRRFRLKGQELEYLRRKGPAAVLEHGAEFTILTKMPSLMRKEALQRKERLLLMDAGVDYFRFLNAS